MTSTKTIVEKYCPESGFTLIETMIAITILTFAMAGPLFIAGRSIVAAQTARDQLTAAYLAQEGIEYVRMMRDNSYLKAYSDGGTNVSRTAWENFLDGPASSHSTITKCRSPRVCTLDPLSDGVALSRCPNEKCSPLYLTGCVNGPGGLSCTPPNTYTQQELSGSARSPFTRTIQAIDISASEEKIVSTVSWNFHNTAYSVTVSDHLTSWQ